MSQSTYSRLEHGDWPIDDALLLKIAGLLRVCPNQFYAGNQFVFMAAVHPTPDVAEELR